MDANLGPWASVSPVTFVVGATPATLRLAWDETALRVLFEIGDATSVTLGREDEDPDLGLKSDSVELFLDVHGEATPRMDTNDYQFTVSRDGRRTTFKGSSALSGTVRPEMEADAAPQPKDWGMNVPIEVAVADGPEAGPGKGPGYRVEIAVPWAAVGGKPASDAAFGVSAAVNDLAMRPGEPVPMRASVDFQGRAAYESPAVWAAASLQPPGSFTRLARNARPWAAVALGVLAVFVAVGWRVRKAAVLRATAPPPVLAAGETSVSGDDPIERLKQNLPARLREDLTAETLAEIAGVSLRTLQRIFRERFDTTPMSWLMEARLLEAARVIRAGDDPVTKIAYRVGFKDPSHFTRRFKARFGVSPNEYRRGAEGAPDPSAGGTEDPE
ncbi:MAG: helix-turn-helix domain-containing protein [Acidobacteria bacterium]|nr:helix-turn-helix domain-containing protein [Acidobacteriota bacterium]